MIARFDNAFKGVTIEETFNPSSFQHPSTSSTPSNPITKFSLLPPAGIMSEVYEKQRQRGIPLYTPVTDDDLNEICNGMKGEKHFTSDCDALIGDVENGRIGSTLSEGIRRFDEESIPQGELIFPDDASFHDHSSTSRSPSHHRNRSRSYSSRSRSCSRSRSRSRSRSTDRRSY